MRVGDGTCRMVSSDEPTVQGAGVLDIQLSGTNEAKRR